MANTLPDVKSKFVFDYSDLTKAEKASAKAHGEFQAGAKASTTHNLRFEQSLTTLIDRFGGMPPVVNQAGRSIESMASQGVSGMTLIGGAALVAVGAIAEVVGTSIKSYSELAAKVEDYRRVVGGSAEESGRMVQTFQALGVGADTATSAMFKLSKAADQHAAKLAALGIEVAKEKNGDVDLSKTLLNVADAYNATGDQVKKNAILLLAFGKTGKDMIPILEQGSAALRQLEESARLVFTEEDLARAKKAEIQNREVKQSWDAMWQSIGQQLIPAQSALAESVLRGEYVQKRLGEALNAGKISQDDLTAAQGQGSEKVQKLRTEFEHQFDASQKVTVALDTQAAAAAALTAKNEELWASADKLITQEEAQVNAGFALVQADLAIKESQDRITETQIRARDAGRAQAVAQAAANQAIKDYGYNSEQAQAAIDALNASAIASRKAADDVSRAEMDQEKAYYAAAAAARKLQQDTDLAADGQKNATKETEAYVAKLQAEADSLAPSSPLRKRLQDYIDKLKNEIPAEVTTKFLVEYNQVIHLANRQGGNVGFAEGGRPPVGAPYWVGEKGPELRIDDRPGTIVPHDQSVAATHGGGNHYNLTLVGTPVVNDPDGVLRALQRMEAIGAGF